jgi:hypothetical protein
MNLLLLPSCANVHLSLSLSFSLSLYFPCNMVWSQGLYIIHILIIIKEFTSFRVSKWVKHCVVKKYTFNRFILIVVPEEGTSIWSPNKLLTSQELLK